MLNLRSECSNVAFEVCYAIIKLLHPSNNKHRFCSNKTHTLIVHHIKIGLREREQMLLEMRLSCVCAPWSQRIYHQ